MIAGRPRALNDPRVLGPGANPGMSSAPDVGVLGNSKDSKDAFGDRFVFESGDDSNVVVTVDNSVRDSEGRVRVKVDVYYV